MVVNQKAVRLLFITAGFAILLWLMSIILFQRHYTFDPYTWATPGSESIVSRNAWLARRNLYIATGILSFLAAAISGVMALAIRRRNRLP